ncbi:type I restriction endonuclease subunit S [Enterobacter sp. ENT02]|uniref:restriction endonuclease subunit S n=1 Tax=Enterobacter sp. ENT02 TaxID=2854767 RepID=UPI00210C8C6F|nr:type I restriction endonuclease subunit S [Enterobacter sp. ENT02]
MDAQQFLAEFGHIANAPGGVVKLRELVLQLAISGRLTERVANDTSALELIEDNQNCQKILLEQKKLKRRPFPGAVTTSEQPWILPKGWAWTRLGSVTNYGDAPKVELKDVSEDTWVLELEDIEKNTSKLLAKVFARDRQFKSIKNGFPKGAVLYGKLRPYLDKVLIADSSGVCTTEINPISFFANIDAGYLRWYLKSPFFIAYANGSTHGMNLPRLGTDAARDALFAFPPLKEQACIVAKVNELMALCDKLETQQQARRKLQNSLRQSILQAVSSAPNPNELHANWTRLADNFDRLFHAPEDVADLRKLVSELAIRGVLDIYNEPTDASTVDDYLAELRRKKSGKRFAKSVQPDEEFSLPNGWRWVLLEDLLSDSESGWSPKCEAEPRREGEWGVLKVSAVTWGIFDPNENKRLPLSLEARPECTVRPGDFILSRANTAELVARSVIAPDDCPEKLLMSDKIVRLNFLDNDLKPWVNLVNNSVYSRVYYKERATGTSDSMRNVSRQVIHELPIPLPSLKEQERILLALNRLLHHCDSLEKQAASRIELSTQLAACTISGLAGLTIEQQEEPMKAPQTELIAPLRLGAAPDIKAQAPLATILARHHGELSAKDLWQRFGGEIDDFYTQLKTEVAHGWILEPTPAEVREKPTKAETA